MADMMILWDKATDDGQWSGGNWRPTLPLSNLALDDIAVPARSVTADPTDSWCRVDLGRTVLIGAFALLRHTVSVAGRVRFAVSFGGDVMADSGWLDARPPDIPWGSLPWGAMPWTGHTPEPALQPGVSLWLPDVAVPGDAVWLWIDDPGNGAGYIDVGRLIAGPVFRPQFNMNYGVSVDPGSRGGTTKRTRGGRKLRTGEVLTRGIDLTLEHVGSGPGLPALHDLAALGPDHSLVVAYDAADSAAMLPRRSFYGSLVDGARIVTNGPDIYSCSLRIEEEL